MTDKREPMSWAVRDWKEGLPTRALQKIRELEGQLDKLQKERQQRQFQLETLEAMLQKQTQKVENEKMEATTLQKENQSLVEPCENLEKAKQTISHKLQDKESQLYIQERQLCSTKKQVEKLEWELKSDKSELERSQKAAQPADVSGNTCNTAQKVFTLPITPSQYDSGPKYEDQRENYSKEDEEQKRLEGQVKNLLAKEASQVIRQNTMEHLNIGQHQASWSASPWQQEQTPSPLSSDALQTPIRRGCSASHFSHRLKVTPSSRSTLQVGQRGAGGSLCDNSSRSQLLHQRNAQSQERRAQAAELELLLPGHEKEMKVQVNQWPELQLQQDKAKMELNEKEKVLNKSSTELTAQYDQASAKYTALEQKLRKLSEDLSFYHQNAESSRCSLEQKLKFKEKQFREELSSQQRAFQILHRESSQVKGRLTQELQQAKNARNILQAELHKVTSGKHQLERELEELKQHLDQTQQALQASQATETELRRNSEEMKKENGSLKSQSQQSAREVCHLQEELKKTKQCLSQSQNFAEEMRAKNASQETMLRDLQEQINQQENSLTSEKLKLASADLEKQRDGSRALLKEKEHHVEQALQGRSGSCDRDVQQDLSPDMEKVTKTAAVVLVGEGSEEQSLEEKAHLQEQLQSLIKELDALSLGRNQLEHPMDQMNHKKESLVRESDSLQNKLQELSQEDLTVSQSLEAAGVQKGEVTMRMSSTQDKVHLMNNDLETLRVCTEADEEKCLEEMKGPDSKKENLASQLPMAEKIHEATIVHADYSKAEGETLKSQIELLMERLKTSELDLVKIKSEKEHLTQQLQEKQGQVTELDTLHSSMVQQLEAKEEENRHMQEECKAAGEILERELKAVMKEVADLCDDSQARTFPEQSSPVQRVQQLSKSLQKLKHQLEDDDKKQFFVLAKLQETKHQAESLKGEVDQLEKELKKAKKTHERATREAQSSKAEVEKFKAKVEEMAPSLKDLRSDKEKLTKELQKAQERVRDLEQLKASFDNRSREKEQEIVRVKQECKLAQDRLRAQLQDLKDKQPSLGDGQGTWKAREQGLTAQIVHLQLERGQLLQGLDQARSHCITLQTAANGLIQEAQDAKEKLKKREQEISLLTRQIQDQEQQVSKLSQPGGQPQVTRKPQAELERLNMELEQKMRRLQSKNDTLQDTYKVLQNSYRDLQKELESMKREKLSCVERVNSFTSRETELQKKMHETTQKMTDLKEEFNGERNRLTEELNVMSEEMKHNKDQWKELVLENSDLKRSLDCMHKHQMEKEERLKEEIAEYQRQLEEAERRHQTLLQDTHKQHEMEIQTYREKLTSTEECLSSQKEDIDLLKSSKEQLSHSLRENTELLGELIKTKMNNQTQIKQLKKEKERAQGKIDFCLRQYKLMEEEMERLQKELYQPEEAAQEKQKPGALVDPQVDELMTEVKQLKATLEGKSKEAEEYSDKYCSLLTSHQKLERDKEMLEAQVACLSSQQSAPHVQISPLLKSVDSELPPVPCVTEKKGSCGQTKASGKRQRSNAIPENKGGTAPSTPHRFPKRNRKVTKRGKPPAEDAEDIQLEPQGLPEVGKEGPAAIPTGKTSPYILRSTTMASRTSPRLAAQKFTRSLLNICKECHAGTSQPTAAGSRSQKVKATQQMPSDSGIILQEPSARPLATKLRKRQWASSPSEGLKSKRGCPAPSSEAGTESRESCSIQ